MENNEDFTVTIDQSSLPDEVTSSAPDTARIIIENDDSK